MHAGGFNGGYYGSCQQRDKDLSSNNMVYVIDTKEKESALGQRNELWHKTPFLEEAFAQNCDVNRVWI